MSHASPDRRESCLLLTVEETPMSTNSASFKQDLRKSIAELNKLGRTIRGDLRSAGADARRQWKHYLEPQLAHVEKLATDMAAASQAAVARTAAAFGNFQASIEGTAKKSVPRKARRSVAKRTR
jgi:hypothetical protein